MEEERQPLVLPEGLLIGQLYRFNPTLNLPKLLLYRSLAHDCREAYVLRRSTIFIVLAKEHQVCNVVCSGCKGWIHQDLWVLSSRSTFEPISSYRGYEDWQGNNVFLCRGSFMLGSHGAFFAFSLLYIIAFSAFYYIYITQKVPNAYELIITSSLMLAYSVFNLLLTAFLDPGIIPRNPVYIQPTLPPGACTDPKSMLSWKYCRTCNIYRPPRSKHCKQCNNCVLEFDHHCPFTSNCVGLRNRRYFMRFIMSFCVFTWIVFISCLWLIITDLHYLHLHPHDPIATDQALLSNLAGAIEVIGSATVLVMLMPFCWYHLKITALGQTTNEHQNRLYLSSSNPHTKGCLGNYFNLCCSSIPPSLLPPLSSSRSAKDFLNETMGSLALEQVKSQGDFPSYHGLSDLCLSEKIDVGQNQRHMEDSVGEEGEREGKEVELGRSVREKGLETIEEAIGMEEGSGKEHSTFQNSRRIRNNSASSMRNLV